MKLQEEKESLQLDAALNQVSKLTHELTKAKEFEDALNGRSKQMKSITENISQRFQIGADPSMEEHALYLPGRSLSPS